MKLKKWSWIGLLMLCVTLLVGCVDHTSRGYLEELAGKELSRVYPTENIEDLFEQFPKGFTVSQMRVVGDSNVFVYLEAREKGKPLVGTIKQLNSKTKEEEKSLTLQYVDGKFVFENEEEAKKLWPQGKFLFQELQLNKEILSKFKLKDTYYNSNSGGFDLEYVVKNEQINEFLKLENQSQVILGFHGSNANRGYYYSLSVEVDSDFTFIERIEE